MKKAVPSKLFFALTLVLTLCLSSIYAIDVNLKRDSYYSGETLQAEIYGNFQGNLRLDNLGIYLNESVHPIPIEADLVKIDNKYLYYAVLPNTAGNYFLRIENIKHTEGNTESESAIDTPFKISQSNESYLSFSPGFVYTSNDFDVTIKGYNKDQQITVELPQAKFKESFSLGYGSTKTVHISIDSINVFTQADVRINNYLLPVYISPKQQFPNYTNNTINTLRDIIVDVPLINAILMPNVNYYFQILLVNKKREPLNLNLSTNSSYISIYPKVLLNFEGEEIINVTINTKNSFSSFINISSTGAELRIPVNIAVTSNISAVNFSTDPLNIPQKCSEWGGEICNAEKGEACDGIFKSTSDTNNCCIGSCKTKSSSRGWIWGLLIIVIIALVVYFLYKRSGNTNFKGKIDGIFKKRANNYKERFAPSETKEVRNNLTRS